MGGGSAQIQGQSARVWCLVSGGLIGGWMYRWVLARAALTSISVTPGYRPVTKTLVFISSFESGRGCSEPPLPDPVPPPPPPPALPSPIEGIPLDDDEPAPEPC